VYLWHYIPNLSVAILFTALFGLATLAHGWRMVKTDMWFCLPFFIGGICTSRSWPQVEALQSDWQPPVEVAGYIARIFAYYSTSSLGAFIVQAVLLLLPPVLFAATLYMVYARIVRSVQGEHFSAIPPRWMTRLFVCGDLLCLNVQSVGAGLTPHAKVAAIGDAIIVAGLGLQVLIFAVFVVYCARFHRRFRAHVADAGEVGDMPWEQSLNMLYATSLLIQARNVFRMVEYIMGADGYLFSNEWPTYVFDGALMLLVMVGFFVFYPNQLRLKRSGDTTELHTDMASSRDMVLPPDTSWLLQIKSHIHHVDIRQALHTCTGVICRLLQYITVLQMKLQQLYGNYARAIKIHIAI
jgi:hypothetical protein